jgi:multiple sugar transport system substrate-binding protein
MKKFTPRQMGIVIGGVVVLILGFYLITSNLKSSKTPPEVTLSVWGTDPKGYFDGVLGAYQALRPNVTVTYTAIPEEGYEEKVVNALASGEGPDVFMIGSHDIPREMSKLAPAAATQMSIASLRELFPTVVEQDFVSGADVYALPLYSDTLALIYNKDLLDAAGIVAPPKTWTDFQNDVVRLRTLAENGQVVRAGAAMGGSSRTVPHAPDIVYALMLQNGVTMTDANGGNAGFSSDAGLEAFNFYLRFADPASAYYTWSDSRTDALESMSGGNVAMMIGYKSDIDALKKKSPFLNVAAAALPQQVGATQPVTFADYKGLAVSKQSKNAGWAWDFVVDTTTDLTTYKSYATASALVPALRTSIGEVLTDANLGVFAKQALIARSWHENDATKIGALFDHAIQDVLGGRADSAHAIRAAKDGTDQLVR